MRRSTLPRPRPLAFLPAVLLLAAALAVAAAPPSPAAPAAPTFPESPAGRVAAAFVAAFNAADEAAIRSFEETYRVSEGPGVRPLEQRLATFRSLKAEWGALQVERVREEGGEVVVGAKAAKTGEDLDLRFALASQDPPRLRGILIGHAGAAGTTLAPGERDAAVRALAEGVAAQYVFPDKGAALRDMLLRKLAAGSYESVATAEALASALTLDLRATVDDGHLSVQALPAGGTGGPGGSRPPGPPHRGPADEHGFVEARLLPGGIGYVRLDAFAAGPAALERAARAMAAVAEAKALIFDLRHNGGGSPEMIAFLTGYLFPEPRLLNTFVDRDGRRTGETRSAAEVPGRRFGPEVPVAVLTSSFTFSAAEEFAYDLQTQKRATLIGETTGGGAHPITAVRLHPTLVAHVPFRRAVNPVTGTNWEGTGVKPDVAVAADRALEEAERRLRS